MSRRGVNWWFSNFLRVRSASVFGGSGPAPRRPASGGYIGPQDATRLVPPPAVLMGPQPQPPLVAFDLQALNFATNMHGQVQQAMRAGVSHAAMLARIKQDGWSEADARRIISEAGF